MSKVEVRLPEIGEGVAEGELVQWLVKIGEAVKVDQPVVEILTDKATVEIPSPIDGVVEEYKFKEGDIVPVNSVLFIAESDQKVAPAKSHHAEAPSSQPAVTKKNKIAETGPVTTQPSSQVFPPVAEGKILASPSTRKLARELEIDINQVIGSGPAGRVLRDDVMKNKDQGTAVVPTVMTQIDERIPLRGIRRKIAEKMQAAKHIVPHFTLMDEAQVTRLVALREEIKKNTESKVTYLPFVMKALVQSLRVYPMINASIDDAAGEIIYKKNYNIGFAADTPTGLLVPVIKNVDKKSILQLSQEIVQLATKAREGKLSLEEMQGATISITNIGAIGGLSATPIINHPEVAILGMYKIQERPLWLDNEWKPAQFMNFTITADHRLIDGAVAAKFLSYFINRIENPGVLMLDLI